MISDLLIPMAELTHWCPGCQVFRTEMTATVWNETKIISWRHQMETFSALLALCAGNSPVTSEFLSQRPVTRSFNVLFDQRLNKRLSKQSRSRWFKTPSRSLSRHCNEMNAMMMTCRIRRVFLISFYFWNFFILGLLDWWPLITDLLGPFSLHYSEVIMGAIVSQSQASRLFIQPFVQAEIKQKLKLRVTGLC